MKEHEMRTVWNNCYKEFIKIYIKELGQEKWDSLTNEMKEKAFRMLMQDIHKSTMTMN